MIVKNPIFELASCPVFDRKTGKKIAYWDSANQQWVFDPSLNKERRRRLKKELKRDYPETHQNSRKKLDKGTNP